MKFLADAQLPRRLAGLLASLGHEATHTLDLPDRNLTADATLCRTAANENRVLITKDADFVDSFLVRGLPPTLLFVTTGNISNDELLALFRGNLTVITTALAVMRSSKLTAQASPSGSERQAFASADDSAPK